MFDSNFQAQSFIAYKSEIQSVYDFFAMSKTIVYKTKEINLSAIQKDMNIEKQNMQPLDKPRQPTFIKKEDNLYKISELVSSDNYVTTRGKIFSIEASERKKLIMTFFITDYEDSICVKCFESQKLNRDFLLSLKNGTWIEIGGKIGFDTFAKDEVFTANSIKVIEPLEEARKDDAEEKRVELHVHTKMSNMDAVCDAHEFIKVANDWGQTPPQTPCLWRQNAQR